MAAERSGLHQAISGAGAVSELLSAPDELAGTDVAELSEDGPLAPVAGLVIGTGRDRGLTSAGP